jgi:hypothetical protein
VKYFVKAKEWFVLYMQALYSLIPRWENAQPCFSTSAIDKLTDLKSLFLELFAPEMMDGVFIVIIYEEFVCRNQGTATL